MKDPFTTLIKSLESVFHFEPIRQGKYTYPAVQQLKDTIDRYNPNIRHTFIQLLKAVKESLPYLEKWQTDFSLLRSSLDLLAKIHQMPNIDWEKLLSYSKNSPEFQFSTLNHHRYDNLLLWISSRTGKTSAQLEPHELTQLLIDHRNNHGFSQQLSNYLTKEPDFLFNLMMNCKENFIKIAKTRLILYLSDQQLAVTIMKYIPLLVHKQKEPYEQIELLVRKLNEILSNGRSISTILRNTEAKSILDNSIFFQIFQSTEYQRKGNQPP